MATNELHCRFGKVAKESKTIAWLLDMLQKSLLCCFFDFLGTQELYGGLQDFRGGIQQNIDKLMECILNNRSQAAKITVVI